MKHIFSQCIKTILLYRLLVVRDGSFHVQLYSVHCNPLKSNEFCVAGRSQWVRVYDRRNVSKPIHELCPSHLVGFLDFIQLKI